MAHGGQGETPAASHAWPYNSTAEAYGYAESFHAWNSRHSAAI